jgi:hypothetical protein
VVLELQPLYVEDAVEESVRGVIFTMVYANNAQRILENLNS